MNRSDLVTKLARLGIFPDIDESSTNESRLMQVIYGSGQKPLVTTDEVLGKIMELPNFDIWEAKCSDPIIVIAARATGTDSVNLLNKLTDQCAPHWVPWAGGPRPVGPDQWVECLFENGPSKPECEHIARYLTWGVSGGIIAYRCIPTPANWT